MLSVLTYMHRPACMHRVHRAGNIVYSLYIVVEAVRWLILDDLFFKVRYPSHTLAAPWVRDDGGTRATPRGLQRLAPP